MHFSASLRWQCSLHRDWPDDSGTLLPSQPSRSLPKEHSLLTACPINRTPLHSSSLTLLSHGAPLPLALPSAKDIRVPIWPRRHFIHKTSLLSRGGCTRSRKGTPTHARYCAAHIARAMFLSSGCALDIPRETKRTYRRCTSMRFNRRGNDTIP